MRGTQRREVGLALFLVCCGLTVACTNGTSATDEVATTTSSSSTTVVSEATTSTQPGTDEEAVLAAVDGYWEVYLAANNPPDPSYPELSRYMTGDALGVTIDGIANRRTLGQVIRLPDPSRFGHEARTVVVHGDTATVTDCVVDDSVLVDSASGEVLNGRVSTFTFRMGLTLEGAQWKVATVEQLLRQDGAMACS